jgi:Domain of unknown function (DUF4288)
VAFIPKDAEWYVAELVEEIQVEDDSRNVVLRNLTLIRADSPEEAYEKALRFGHEGETEYDNPEAKRVRIKFRGISHLDVIHDKLEDGAELSFCSQQGVSQEQIAGMLCPKEKLEVFREIEKLDGPDFASAEVIQEVEDRFGISRPK